MRVIGDQQFAREMTYYWERLLAARLADNPETPPEVTRLVVADELTVWLDELEQVVLRAILPSPSEPRP